MIASSASVPAAPVRPAHSRHVPLSPRRSPLPKRREAGCHARVVRHTARTSSVGQHLTYLRREGVTRDGDKARLFGSETESVDVDAFTECCRDDRHHFRFIVSPDHALEMEDLRAFTRDLTRQMEKTLAPGWIGSPSATETPNITMCI